MKYDKEVLDDVGSAGGIDGIGVVVFQPHLEFELTCLGLDTADGRRHELGGDDALELAELLKKAAAALAAVPRPRPITMRSNGLEAAETPFAVADTLVRDVEEVLAT